MTDKFKDTFPIEVPFGDGEQPTSQKMTGWSNQTNRGLRLIEQALGDLWNQSQSPGTPLFTQPNQIASLARAIGQMEALNPRILGGLTVSSFAETVPSNVQQFILQHTPSSALSFTPASPAAFQTLKISKNDLTIDGDYFVDTATKMVWTRTATGSGITATYDYQDDNSSYTDATFNVIPHSNQTIKCTITLDAGGAGVHGVALPLITHDQDGALATDGSDPNYNQQSTLPDVLSSLSANDVIPSGFLSLWDNQNSRIQEGATYLYQDQQSLLITGIIPTAGNSRYSLITTGNDITRSVDYLLDRMLNHTHRNDDGSPAMSHSSLKDLVTGGLTDQSSNSLSFANSKIANNDHPMYLHRAGYKYNQSPDDTDEGAYNNAMVGDILMASTSKTGGTVEYVNLSADSFEVVFGDDTGDSPKFGYVNTDDKLQLKGNKPFRINSGSLYLGQDSPAADRRIVAEIGESIEPELLYSVAHQSWRIQRQGGTDLQNLIPPPLGEVTGWWRYATGLSVPFGWQVCDGSPVTDPLSPMFGLSVPDMRDKFLKGTTVMPQDGIASGGADSQAIPNHAHSLSVSGNVTISSLLSFTQVDLEDFDFSFDAFPFSGFTGGNYQYPLSISASMGNDGAVTVNTIPAYIGLNYIVRIR
jgi:hypothetical protein